MFQYQSAFIISMSKIPKGVRLAPPYSIGCTEEKNETIKVIENSPVKTTMFGRVERYSKTCVKRPLKIDKANIIMTNGSPMKVEVLPAILLTCIKR